MDESRKKLLRGVICTVTGGVFWGFSGACGQFLFSGGYEISPLWITCIRLFSGGVVFTLTAIPKHRRAMADIWRHRSDALQLIAYGVFGLLMCQYAYMTAISYSNAATTTVLQTLGPVLIMLYVCLRKRKLPTRREALAVGLAFLGTYLLATGGDPRHMSISPPGLFWGLMTAVAVAVYSLIPSNILPRWGREVITGYGMLIGGAVLALGSRVWTVPLALPAEGWVYVGGIVLFGTLLPFPLFMQGLSDLGPVKSSTLASSEPLSATVFSVVWLGSRFAPTDFAGFACILFTIFLLAKNEGGGAAEAAETAEAVKSQD